MADFGLLLVAKDFLPGSAPVKVQVGTKRYMAPEVLDNSIVTTEIGYRTCNVGGQRVKPSSAPHINWSRRILYCGVSH